MIYENTLLIALSLLLFRIIIALIFFSSGWKHAKDPKARAESIGMSPQATFILGIAEVLGAIFIALGIYSQIGALILILAMMGAIYKKIVVWNTGFYADKGFGWHYDLLLLLGNLVIFATAGGEWVLL